MVLIRGVNRKRSASQESDSNHDESVVVTNLPPLVETPPSEEQHVAAAEDSAPPVASAAEQQTVQQQPDTAAEPECSGCCCRNRLRKRTRPSPEPTPSARQPTLPATMLPPPAQAQLYPPQQQARPPPQPSPFASVRVDVNAPVGLLYQMANAARFISEHVRHKTVTVAEMMRYASLTLIGIVVLMNMLPKHLMDMFLFLLLIVCITVTFLMRKDRIVRQPAPPIDDPTLPTAGGNKCIKRERLAQLRRQRAAAAAN